jgi:hypothetical protein
VITPNKALDLPIGVLMHIAELSESWLQSYLNDVTRLAAQQSGLKDSEWKSPLELIQELETARPNIVKALREFFVVYRRWFDDSREFNQKLLNGTLKQSDRTTSIDLIVARDQARETLVREVRKA